MGGAVMLVFEFKAYGKSNQLKAVGEAIRTAKFVRNSCLRYWMDNKKVGKNDLNKYCAVRDRDFHARRRTQLNGKTCLAHNGHGLLFPDFTITARKIFLVKKSIHNFKEIAARWNTKPVAGNLLTISNQSALPTKKELDD